MTISLTPLKVSSLAMVAGIMSASALNAQEVSTVDTSPIVASPEIVTPTTVDATPTVTPPRVVPTLPSINDRVAPQAQAQVEAERADRMAETQVAKGASSTPRAVQRPAAAPAPFSEAIAPDAASTVNVPSDRVDDLIIDSSMVAPATMDDTALVANDANGGTSEWLLGAGIVGALGLAGIALAMRRRRRPGDVVSRLPAQSAPLTSAAPGKASPSPAVASAFAAPTMDPFFAQQRQARHQSSDPLFATRRDDARPSGDPLFAYKPEQIPVTDPLFSRQIDVPPVTDPMFAHHPDYEGRGADRKVERTSDGEPAGTWRQPQLVN
jgi:hypothetical protein